MWFSQVLHIILMESISTFFHFSLCHIREKTHSPAPKVQISIHKFKVGNISIAMRLSCI